MRPQQSPPYWQRAFSRAPPRPRQRLPHGLQSAAASCMDCGLQSAAARARRFSHAHRWPSRQHRQHLFLAVCEISGCDADLWCRVTQAGHTLRLRQPRIQGPPHNAGGAPTGVPGAIASAAIAIGAAAAVCCSARRLPVGVRPRTAGHKDCARSVLAGPYRAPVAPRSALPGITRTMAYASEQQIGQHYGINEHLRSWAAYFAAAGS
jgi:hypothetical protein